MVCAVSVEKGCAHFFFIVSGMMREIEVHCQNGTTVPVEELCKLRNSAFRQWEEKGLDVIAYSKSSVEHFSQYLRDKTVFVAHDAVTGELLAMHTLRLNRRKGSATGSNLAVVPTAKREGIASRMLQEEVRRLRKEKIRSFCGSTAIPAAWSVRWHLKNGYRIVGYSRSEKHNYASYVFRKQIAIDLRHHPADIFWTKPLAPITALVCLAVSYVATCICKTRSGKLNAIGRMAKKVRRRFA